MRRAALFLVLAGCLCRDPWNKFPEPTPPDEQYSLGSGTHGHDVYVWRCLRGRRVVVSMYSAEMACHGAERDTAACGEQTRFELETAGQRHAPARDTRGWR